MLPPRRAGESSTERATMVSSTVSRSTVELTARLSSAERRELVDGLPELVTPLLQLGVGFLELDAMWLNWRARTPSSSRFGTSTRWEKSPDAYRGSTVDSICLTGPMSAHGDRVAEHEGQRDARERERDHDPGGTWRTPASLASRPGGHVRLGLVHEIVGDALEPGGQRAGLRRWRSPDGFGGVPARTSPIS